MPNRRAVIAMLLASAATPSAALPALLPSNATTTLIAAARALFPHAEAGDSVYARIVASVMSKASPSELEALKMAAAALAGPPGQLRERIAAAIALPGIQALRIATLIGLYSDLNIVRRFGYPGPSIDFGGYLEHGFGDLPWLPVPPPAWLP